VRLLNKEESNDDISISKDSNQPSNDAVPPIADGPAALTFRTAFQKIAPELQTVETQELLTIHIDVTTAVTTATGALPEIMTLRESASKVGGGVDIKHFDPAPDRRVGDDPASPRATHSQMGCPWTRPARRSGSRAR